MRRNLFLVISTSLVLYILAGAQTTNTTTEYAPLMLPSGKKFPTSQAALLKLRDDQDVTGMRTHAWEIFAGLTNGSRGSHPIWETWFTKCDAGVSSTDCKQLTPSDKASPRHFLGSIEIPTQLILGFQQSAGFKAQALAADRAASALYFSQFIDQFKQHPQFASVLFNRTAAEHIRKEKLFTAQGIGSVFARRVASHSPDQEREIDPFPNGSVALKTTWALVSDNGGNLPTLYIPNPTVLASKRASGMNQSIPTPSDWGTSVRIDTSSKTTCEDRDYVAEGDNSAPIVPLDCFYSYKFDTEDDANAFPRNLGRITGYGSIIPGHTFLILVGVHAITKETPDWVWTTFWWQNKTSHAPARVHGNRWRHFLMDTTLSNTTPFEPAPDYGPKMCFNPYLEAQFPNGIVSNCVRCHEHAVYTSNGQHAKVLEGLDLGSPWRDGTPANSRPKNCHYFDDALRTDFMWSLANQQDASITAFLSALAQYIQER